MVVVRVTSRDRSCTPPPHAVVAARGAREDEDVSSGRRVDANASHARARARIVPRTHAEAT